MTPTNGQRGLGWTLVAIQFVLLGGIASEVRHTRRTPGWLRGVGVVGAVAGGAIVGLASARLGGQLTAHPAPTSEAVLRTDGPYRFVRHPIYSGLLLFGAGLAAIAGTARAAALLGGLVALLSFKARFEEGLLVSRFPDYEAYASRTPRFVPRPSSSDRAH